MKNLTVPFLMIFFVLLMNCSFLTASPSDDLRIRPTGSFTAITVSSGINLYISQGTSEKVAVEGNQDDAEKIITEIKNGTLHIYRKNRSLFDCGFLNQCTVHVTVKSLEALDASSGTGVKGINRLVGNEFRLHCSSGCEVNMEINYKKIKADASSGSEVHLKGSAEFFELSVSSGSELDACGLTARTIYAEASSGAEACVCATDELKAHASSGGDIDYRGNPKILDINKSSGGRIRCNTLSKNNYFCPSNWKVPDYRNFFLLS
jgi:hypothetical protein